MCPTGPMQRIAIIGSSGAGKTTLARRIGQMLGIEVVHLDALYWQPGWTETDPHTWNQLQHEIVQRDRWVIEGNYGNTLQIRLDAADTVIFLDLPRLTCLCRAFIRSLRHLGRNRPDMGPGCPEKLDPTFFKWIWTFPAHSRPTILRQLETLASTQGHKTILRLRSRREVKRFLQRLERAQWIGAD